MLTLQLHPFYTIQRTLQAPRLMASLGGLVMQATRRAERPTYAFTLRDPLRRQAEAEALYSFAAYHQGDRAFWWSGDIWGTPSTPLLVGFGDGAQTEFFLPNRHITNIPEAYVDGALASPQPSVDSAPGLLTFASPVGVGARITAQYTCRYKVVFADADAVLNESYIAEALFRYEGIGLVEIVP